MNLTQMRLRLAVADLATLPDMISLADMHELFEWMGKSSTGIPENVRALIEQTIRTVAERD